MSAGAAPLWPLWLLALASLGYLVASIGFQANLFLRRHRDWRPWTSVLLASHAFHTVGLLGLAWVLKRLPVGRMDEAVSSLAWLVIGLYVLLGHRWKVEVLGTVAAPAACVMTALSTFILWGYPAQVESHGPWFWLHVGSLVSSYAAFSLAAFCALLYFVQSRLLKKKRLTGMFQMMPSLDTLDRLAYRLILLGFPLCVLGIASGMLTPGFAWHWDFKETLVGVTCAVYLVYLHARLIAGWQGRKVNLILLVAFACVLLSLLAPGRVHPLR